MNRLFSACTAFSNKPIYKKSEVLCPSCMQARTRSPRRGTERAEVPVPALGLVLCPRASEEFPDELRAGSSPLLGPLCMQGWDLRTIWLGAGKLPEPAVQSQESRGVGKGWKEWESERKAGRLRAPLCNPGRRYLRVGKSASSASGNFLWSHKQYLTLRIFPR